MLPGLIPRWNHNRHCLVGARLGSWSRNLEDGERQLREHGRDEAIHQFLETEARQRQE
jgi:hypothetical protein